MKLLFFIGLISSSLFANYPFEIEADKVNFQNTTQELNATGNIILNYKEYTITGEKMHYSKQTNQLYLNENVKIADNKNNVLHANKIKFNLNDDIGTISNGELKSNRNIKVTGKRIKLKQSEIQFFECTITTCKSRSPEWYILSKKLTVNKESSLIDANDNIFYFYNVPIFILPNFAQSLSNEEYANKPSTELGYNPIDHTFINLHYGYIISPLISGKAGIGVSQKRGFRYGAYHTLALQPNKSISLHTYDVEKTGFEGGVRYQQTNTLTSDNINLLNNLFFTSMEKELPTSKLTIEYMFDKIAFNELYHAIPEASFKLRNLRGPLKNLISGSILYGYYRDRINLGNKYRFDLQAKQNLFTFKQKTKLSNSVEFKFNHYDNNQKKWERFYNTLEFDFPILTTTHQLSFTKMLTQKGQSPFIFDTINEITNDEISLLTAIPLDPLTFSVNANYEINKETFRNFIYSVKLTLECWALSMNVNTVWNEVSFDVSIPNF
ncbi:MAG: hypothetical protein ACON35_04665 [Candidatus Marinamargulisbacteria bacterium]